MSVTIDCPLCMGEATTDTTLTSISCASCRVDVEIVPDAATLLDMAA